MLYFNNLQAGCAVFPTAAGTQLCMPHTCETYTVQQNDKFAGLVQQFGYAFTQSQLVAWNVDINRVCVDQPGGPTNLCVSGTTVAEASSCYATTYANTDAWTFPVLNSTASTTTAASNWTSISVTPVATYPVTQSAEPTPTPHQAQMASGCTDFYKVVDRHNFLQLDVYVCVSHDSASTATATTKTTSATTTSSSAPAPPGPTQAGIPADCNKWILQQDGVYCYDMASNADIDLACLYELNPALRTDAGECQGLWQGYAYCVGTKGLGVHDMIQAQIISVIFNHT
ncbi:putative LysM domain-containing protein [Seiridium unicorne]|uniref:LysM domain-containing protein n=1 Tax=Seiridium unicorne TaxID=138068 RepID=A0ABR2UF70_9PEZI